MTAQGNDKIHIPYNTAGNWFKHKTRIRNLDYKQTKIKQQGKYYDTRNIKYVCVYV